MAMGALKTVVSAGVVAGLAAPSLTETILAQPGLILHVENGATSSTVGLVDGGVTPAGTAGTTQSIVVGASSKQFIAVSEKLVNPSTGLITITFTNATTITAEWLLR